MGELDISLHVRVSMICTTARITSWAAFPFMRTYVLESGRSPTWTIARPGLNLGLLFCISIISSLTFSLSDLERICISLQHFEVRCFYLAIAVPSILCATIDVLEVWNKRCAGAGNEIARGHTSGDDVEDEEAEAQMRIDLCWLRTRLPNLSIRLSSSADPDRSHCGSALKFLIYRKG